MKFEGTFIHENPFEIIPIFQSYKEIYQQEVAEILHHVFT